MFQPFFRKDAKNNSTKQMQKHEEQHSTQKRTTTHDTTLKMEQQMENFRDKLLKSSQHTMEIRMNSSKRVESYSCYTCTPQMFLSCFLPVSSAGSCTSARVTILRLELLAAVSAATVVHAHERVGLVQCTLTTTRQDGGGALMLLSRQSLGVEELSECTSDPEPSER